MVAYLQTCEKEEKMKQDNTPTNIKLEMENASRNFSWFRHFLEGYGAILTVASLAVGAAGLGLVLRLWQ